MPNYELLRQLIYSGQVKKIPSCMQTLLDEGADAESILTCSISPAMDTVGYEFETNRIFIPEMLIAARASKLAIEILHSRNQPVQSSLKEKMLIGTVASDLHDIGKMLVADSVAARGIEVIDLGVDVAPERFVEAVEQDENIAIVGLSALLTTTMPFMRETVRALRKSRAYSRFCIMIGGAPVTEDFAKKIHADFYTKSANECAVVALKIIKERQYVHALHPRQTCSR